MKDGRRGEERLCQGGGLEVFVKDMDKGRRGGVGLHPKASDKREEPPHVRHPFLCGQPFD